MKFPAEELEPNDGVDEDDEEDQEGNVKKRYHRSEDRIQHDLQTWKNTFG